MKNALTIIGFLLCIQLSIGQTVELYQQFNGRFDYTAIGNTLNLAENGPFSECDILTTSSADLNLNSEDTIVAAYLYWAGSGSGDFEVLLNNTPVLAERTFNDALDNVRIFFAAYADVTAIVLEQGNGTYTLSNLDLTETIEPYCPTGTNFAGWAIAIVYENSELPLNQVNIYDGLESVPSELSITLNNLNVLDTENAKIGFVAWEGDSALAVTEQLSINGNVLSNLPLNPEDNAFNGTNSFTNQNDLYNMDLDVYNIQNNIAIGDTSATISLTSGQDFVMINSIITVLNSQLPDATISIFDEEFLCGNRNVQLDYTVYNVNSTEILPSGVPVAFYIDGNLIAQDQTDTTIPIGGSATRSINISVPDDNTTIEIEAVVDDIGDGTGIVTEIDETNNSFTRSFDLLEIPDSEVLDELVGCNEGFNQSSYDLYNAIPDTLNLVVDNISFYTAKDDAELAINPIPDPFNFSNNENPQLIYIREETDPCYRLFTFSLVVENCPPQIPEGFSPNMDGINDVFNIKGLYNIFLDHNLRIYNRNGSLIFQGDNTKKWDGKINRGTANKGNQVPTGTYYYVLDLNHEDYQPIAGWVYVNY